MSPKPAKQEYLWQWLPVLVASALAIIIISFGGYFGGLNHSLFLYINHAGSALPERLWAILSYFGDAGVILLVFSLFAVFRPQYLFAIIPAILIATPLSHLAKHGFDLARPLGQLNMADVHVIGPKLYWLAFPSGHSLSVFLGAGLLVLIFKNNTFRFAVLSFATMVALSRCMVGAHWPVDILVGAASGWLTALLAMRIINMAAMRWSHNRISQSVVLVLILADAAYIWGFDSHFPSALFMSYPLAIAASTACLYRLNQLWRISA